MARISIVLVAPDSVAPNPYAQDHWREALQQQGHTTEIIEVLDSDRSGPVAAMLQGLRSATGDVLVALDPGMGYTTGDLTRLVEPLAEGSAELTVACRFLKNRSVGQRWRRWSGALIRALTGASDPLSGLIGMTRDTFEELAPRLEPIGRKLSLELLRKRQEPWNEIPASALATRRMPRPGVDDFRQIKRLSDQRYGNLSRLVQFCFVGASGMVVDLTSYAALHSWLLADTWLARRLIPFVGGTISLELVVSAALAILIALTWNFLLNRSLTFSDSKGGSLRRQYLRYALSNALGISVSFTLRLALPAQFAFFHAHKLAAAVVGIVVATGITFSMARWFVFRPEPVALESPPANLTPLEGSTSIR